MVEANLIDTLQQLPFNVRVNQMMEGVNSYANLLKPNMDRERGLSNARLYSRSLMMTISSDPATPTEDLKRAYQEMSQTDPFKAALVYSLLKDTGRLMPSRELRGILGMPQRRLGSR